MNRYGEITLQYSYNLIVIQYSLLLSKIDFFFLDINCQNYLKLSFYTLDTLVVNTVFINCKRCITVCTYNMRREFSVKVFAANNSSLTWGTGKSNLNKYISNIQWYLYGWDVSETADKLINFK